VSKLGRDALACERAEESEIHLPRIAMGNHNGSFLFAAAAMSAEENEDLVLVGSTRERMTAREHKTLGSPFGLARSDCNAGAGSEALAIALEDDLDRGRHDLLDDILAAWSADAFDRAPRTQYEDDGAYRQSSHS